WARNATGVRPRPPRYPPTAQERHMTARSDRPRRPSRALLLRGLALALAILPAAATAQPPPRDAGTWQASGTEGAAVARGAGAVEAGIEALKGGGNAADAAVATILALNVTDATAACFGGEVPILVYDARTGAVEVLAGQGAAPALATRDHFAARGGIPAKGL